MAPSATVTIRVPAVLRAACNGSAELSLSAGTVRAALEELERSYPALHRSICDETGRIRPHVNLFVNTSRVHHVEGLGTALEPGDVVSVMPAVSGG
jgi:adenylyltransferase/sulfurtransferase